MGLPLTIRLGFALGFLGLTQPLVPSGRDLSRIEEKDGSGLEFGYNCG